MLIRDHSGDNADSANDTHHFSFGVHAGPRAPYTLDDHVGCRTIQHTRQKGLTANQPVDINAPVQQAHDGFNSMWAATDHHGLIYAAQAAAQVKIVIQTMECKHAIEIPSW